MTEKGLVLHARKSSDDGGQMRSVTNQIALLRRLAEEEFPGVPVIEEIQEHDISGWAVVDRPGLARLIGLVESDCVVAVLVWRESRLARHEPTLRELANVLRQHNVRLHVQDGAQDRYNFRKSNSVKSFLHAALDAEFFSTELSDAIKVGVTAKAMDGDRHGGQAPFGYRDVPVLDENGQITIYDPKTGRIARHRVIVPEEAREIRQAASAILEGTSLWSVVQDWKARGIVGRRGQPISHTAMRTILTNPVLTGLRRHRTSDRDLNRVTTEAGDKLYEPSHWEPILDRVTWERLQMRLRIRPGHRAPRKAIIPGTILRCAEHDVSMYFRTLQDGDYRRGTYSCSKERGRLTISAVGLEAWVRDQVANWLDPERTPVATENGTVAALLAERENLVAKSLQDSDDEQDGRISRDLYLHRTERANARLAQIDRDLEEESQSAELVNVRENWSGPADETRARWDLSSPDEKRFLIEQVFRFIKVGPATKPGARFDETRLDWEFRG
jgi:DNA invertase Pin-like site-specific DNA recombinase